MYLVELVRRRSEFSSSLSFLRISIKQASPVRSSLHTFDLFFYFSPAYVVAACGCTDNEEWSAEAPEEVVQRRLYLPLLGMLILAPLFKASPTAALMA